MIRNSTEKRKIEARRLKVSEFFFAGIDNQNQLADLVGVDRSTISRDLKVIQKEWQKKYINNINEVKGRELAKIGYLERTYWEAWEWSKALTKTNRIKSKETDSVTKTVKCVNRNGDPRYLQGIQWCIEQRCKILGTYQQANMSGLTINLVSTEDVNIKNC